MWIIINQQCSGSDQEVALDRQLRQHCIALSLLSNSMEMYSRLLPSHEVATISVDIRKTHKLFFRVLFVQYGRSSQDLGRPWNATTFLYNMDATSRASLHLTVRVRIITIPDESWEHSWWHCLQCKEYAMTGEAYQYWTWACLSTIGHCGKRYGSKIEKKRRPDTKFLRGKRDRCTGGRCQ